MTVKLEQALAIGHAAIEYTHTHIKKGATWLENNKLPRDRVARLHRAVRDIRKAEKIDKPLITTRALSFFDNNIKLTTKYSIGNCGELSYQALFYILTSVQQNINAESFKIHGGDHNFLVLNRKPGSFYWDPKTWGPDAVICDPWSMKVYKADQYQKHLKNYVSYEDDPYRNYVEKLKKEHILVPIKNMNTSFLREKRTATYLHQIFDQKTTGLVNVIESYRDKLKSEHARLISSYGDDNLKTKIVSDKLQELNFSIRFINNSLLVTGLQNKSDINYEAVKSRLEKIMLQNRTYAINAMQFSKSETTELFAYQHEYKNDLFYRIKTSIQRFFHYESTTKTNLTKITQATNDSLVRIMR